MKIQSCCLPSFLAHSHSLLLYDSMRPHRVLFDSNNQLQDLSTNTHLICGCPGFQRVRQPSAPLAHCLCCFFSLSLLHNKSDTHKDEAVKNKCSNWANQFRCSQVIKCCSQGKVTAGALPRRQIYHTSLFPTLCWKRKDKKNLQLLVVHYLKCQKQLGPDTSPSSGSNMQTRGNFLCHSKNEQSLDSLFFSNLLSGNIWILY